VDVVSNNQLSSLNKHLITYLKDSIGLYDVRAARFHAHMTIAHRDLKHWVFPEAWAYFSSKEYNRTFKTLNLSLMEYRHGAWEVYEDFPIGS
jgi:2'-5' RNA ligase